MHRTPEPGNDNAPASGRRYTHAGRELAAPQLAPGLYVVATPIGNLRDMTLRAIETLAAADAIACEDTRVTRKLTDHYGIATPLTPYHEHNAAEARPKLLARLAADEAVALVSDAGTPLVSDPGFKLVRAAREAGHAVTAVPGPSALLAALTIAGLPSDRFHFEGFLPPKHGTRRNRIAALAALADTLILFEAGPRLAASLTDLAAGLGAREAAICRELTKLHEEVRRGPLAELAAHYANVPAPKGEIVLVIAPASDEARAAPKDIDAMLRDAMLRGSLKDAVAEVATVAGEPRGEVYRRALALSRERNNGEDA